MILPRTYETLKGHLSFIVDRGVSEDVTRLVEDVTRLGAVGVAYLRKLKGRSLRRQTE